MGFSLLLPSSGRQAEQQVHGVERRHAETRRAARAPQARLPVLHMTGRRKGRIPDAPGHAPAMGGARNGNPHAGLLYPAAKCNFDKYRRAVKVYLG